MDPTALIIGIACMLAFVVFIVVGILAMIARFYRKVDQGWALIINKMKDEPEVTFTGGVVLPIIHRSELMDISVKTIEIARGGSEGLICHDNIRADIKVAFYVRVNKTKEDVLKVAQSIGCKRASDQQTLEELFVAKFSEALKSVGKNLDFEELYTQREDFKDRIIEVIGRDLNGYVLEDAAIDYLEQTSKDQLDEFNILDAQGIRKITEITADQRVLTNNLEQEQRKTLAKQNLEADEAILELERRKADAVAKQQREIAVARAREAAETAKVEAEEKKRSEMARLQAEEEIEIQDLKRQRQVQVADKDRVRVVAIKEEQVERDRQMEVIGRERVVDIGRIEKEKEVEVKKKEIADVVSTRIAVEKKVAEEEERIKDLRAIKEADRKKTVQLTQATADAEEALVKEIKAAEAAEKVAEFEAKQKLILAKADFEAADKTANAKIRLAEGTQAEVAAEGLAQVKVKEADAVAIEKTGMAEAKVRMAAADAAEKEGTVKAHVDKAQVIAMAEGREREAAAVRTMGEAEADATRIKLLAEAEGREAEAKVIQATGIAKAKATEEQMAAEAVGLSKKLEAMKAMEGPARDHEEFRLRLEQERVLQLQNLETQQAVAAAQAQVMSEAMANADIRIVGGDGGFMDQFVRAASLGQSIDGFLHSSEAAQAVAKPYLDGSASLTDDVKQLTGAIAGSPDKLRDGALAAWFAKMLANSDDETRGKLEQLLAKAQELGLEDVLSGKK